MSDLRAIAERVLQRWEKLKSEIDEDFGPSDDVPDQVVLARAVLSSLDVPDDVQQAMEILRNLVEVESTAAGLEQVRLARVKVCDHFLAAAWGRNDLLPTLRER